VEFTVLDIPPFQIATDNQEETDRYWSAIVGYGGKESRVDEEDRRRRDRCGAPWVARPPGARENGAPMPELP
jgi:predicted 3-demethylubiquinone-9 3-methyltransferase (glyoxalase superfamily)